MARITGPIVFDQGVIENQHISGSAAIDADKMQHIHSVGENFGLEYNATPVAKVFIVYVAKGTGTLRGFHAMLHDTGTSTSVTFDLKKNGTTVLSGVITIVHGDADKSIHDGTISVPSFVADDVFTVHLAVSSSTGAQGPWAYAEFEENVVA